MTDDARQREEAARDIAAARAEMRGRREQVEAEYDERLQQLESMAVALKSGEIKPKVAQNRVRQLLGDRSGGVSRGTRAGRTQIGMRLPASARGTGHVSIRSGPTPSQASAELGKVQAEVDSRVVTLLMQSSAPETRLELALLGQVRSSLTHQLTHMPSDTVLVESLLEYAGEARAILEDLAAGGVGRLRRLLEYDSHLVSQVVGLGGTVSGLKEQIKQARALLRCEDPDLGQALKDAIIAFERLQAELLRRLSPETRTLFDEIFRAAQ